MMTVITMPQIDDVLEFIKEMQDDSTTPKNVKAKLTDVEQILGRKEEKSMNLNRAVEILVDLSDDVNLQPDIRTRVLNIVSMLESI